MSLPAQTASRGSTWSPGRILSPPFLLALVLLGTAAGLAGPVAGWMGLKQAKRALPLKAPLAMLDEQALRPYRVLERRVLPPAIVDALGTKAYLNWTLEDTSVRRTSPLRFANLLITYYSGGSSLVPHTPDVCYLGSGYSPAQPHETMEIHLLSMPAGAASLPIRVCSFVKTAIFGHETASVIYTFFCNGRFLVNPRAVRVRINALRNTFAFFSKVEVSFPQASREESIQGARRLFDCLLPLLVRNHWPDFEGRERAAREGHEKESG